MGQKICDASTVEEDKEDKLIIIVMCELVKIRLCVMINVVYYCSLLRSA